MLIYIIKMFLNLNFQGSENFESFSQARDLRISKFQELKLCLSLHDHEYVKKSAFDWLAAKL